MRMKSRSRVMGVRGQAALEYLMTYGWAILVIAVIGVILWSQGVFQPAAVQPGCSGFSQLVVLDNKLSGDTFSIVVNNEAGTKLTVAASSAVVNSQASVNGDFADDIRPGQSKVINYTLASSVTSGEYYSANVQIDYTNTLSGIDHQSVGKCWGNAE